MIDDLIELAFRARGGRELWSKAATITANVHVYGGFWAYKGHGDLLGFEAVTLSVNAQKISMTPYGDGNTLHFDAALDVVTITRADGVEIDRLENPRASMKDFAMDTKWTPAQMGYFISYATWTYLLVPHLFTLPGVETREIEPWSEDGETWRRLEVTFPDSIATHNRTMIYYFDAATGDERRMDYDVVVNGFSEVAHYVSEFADHEGLKIPGRRRVLHRDSNNRGMHEHSDILLDVSNVTRR